MNRRVFMERLEALLADIPQAEREEALNYYENYFDDAGVENEARVIRELGSPDRVAAEIKANLGEAAGEYGEYTERGYEDARSREKTQVPGKYRGRRRRKRGGGAKAKGLGPAILILLLLVFLSPFLTGIVGGVLGIFVMTESADGEESDNIYEIPVQADMELSVKIAYETLFIEPGDGETIRIEVKEDDDLSVKQDGKKLHINSAEKSRKRKDGVVTVYYPENTEFASVDIEVGAGEGNISGTLMAKELDVEVGVGSLSGSGEVKAEECSFDVGVGELKLSRVAAAKIVGECGVGSLEMTLAGSWEDYNYELECAMGDLDVGNDSYSGFAAEKRIDNGADKNVDIACGIGDVKVDFTE